MLGSTEITQSASNTLIVRTDRYEIGLSIKTHHILKHPIASSLICLKQGNMVVDWRVSFAVRNDTIIHC